MALFDSRSAYFSINDGSERDLTAYVTNVGEDLPGVAGLHDATTLGDTGTKDVDGLDDTTFVIRGLYDDTATTGPEAVIGALWSSRANATFRYGPKGSTAGFLKYSGSIKVAAFNAAVASVGNLHTFEARLKVQGRVTRGTF